MQPLRTTILLLSSMNLTTFNTSYKWSCSICIYVIGLFHLSESIQDISMLFHVAKFPQDGYQNNKKKKKQDKSIDEDKEKLEPYTPLVGLQNRYNCY